MTDRPELRTLGWALIHRQYVLRRRYLFDTVTQLLIMYVIFLMVFLMGVAVAPTVLGEHLEALVVGYFVWVMAIRAFRSLSQDLLREAQWGTLEQLYVSPYGFGRVTVVQTTVNVLESFLWGAAILVLLVLTTRQWLHFDLLTVVPLLVLTVASAAGIGFVLGGLTLLYKRLQGLITLVQFLFIAFISAPIHEYSWLKLLPLSMGTDLLGTAMSEGHRLWELPTADVVVLFVTGIGYLTFGYVVFLLAQRRARRNGILGHY